MIVGGDGKPSCRPSSKFYVGLDFGTARSGFSYCTLGGNVNVNLKWAGNPGQAYCKTLTALAYSRGNPPKAEAWGWEACSEQRSLPAVPVRDYLIVERFKLLLASSFSSEEQKQASLQQNLPKELCPELLVADFLRSLKEYALKHIADSYGSLDPETITWVLTTPAGWSSAAVQTMRRAAVLASIIPQVTDPRLVMAIEPEAAALCILNDARHGLSMREHDSLVVVDAGGGTVDITAHNIKKAMGEWVLEECYIRQCLLKGSTFLDQAFEEWLAMQFGRSLFTSWKDAHPAHYSKFFHTEWESAKINFRGENKSVLTLPKSLTRFVAVEELARVNDDWNAAEEGELILSAPQMKRLFDSLIDDILKRVGSVLDNIGGRCDHMVLVGGFGESQYFLWRLREEFGRKVNAKISTPDSPSQAVLKGAALYGQRQSAIAVRRTRFAYGVGTNQFWTPGRKESRRWYDVHSQQYMEGHVFDKMVDVNQPVKHDEVMSTIQFPANCVQKAICFPIFASTSDTATHTDDPSMFKLGEVELQIPPGARIVAPQDYRFKVDLTVGATELGVTATDLQTGKGVSAGIQYIDKVC